MSDVSVQQMNQTVILNNGDVSSKTEIKTYFNFTWNRIVIRYTASEEGFYERPQPLRHPLIFYLGILPLFCE